MADKKNTPKPTPTTTTTTTPSGDITDLAGQYGITPNVGAYYTPADPPAWDGTKTRPSSSVDTDFYKLDPAALRKFQADAYQAGLYGPHIQSEIRVGDYDDLSFQVWKGLVDRSAGFNAAGKKIAPLDALTEAMKVGNPQQAQPPIRSTNPADVHALATQEAQQGLGYGLTADQHQRVQADFHQAEAPYLAQDSTTGAPSAQGWADWAQTEVRNIDPTRFDARKVVSGFDVLDRMIKGQI